VGGLLATYPIEISIGRREQEGQQKEMADRLYTIEGNPQGGTTFSIFDFEERQVRRVAENPHPDGSNTLPPFYVDKITFDAVVGQIQRLDEINPQRARTSF